MYFNVRGQQKMDFFIGVSVIMDYGLVFLARSFKLTRLNDRFVSYEHTAFGF